MRPHYPLQKTDAQLFISLPLCRTYICQGPFDPETKMCIHMPDRQKIMLDAIYGIGKHALFTQGQTTLGVSALRPRWLRSNWHPRDDQGSLLQISFELSLKKHEIWIESAKETLNADKKFKLFDFLHWTSRLSTFRLSIDFLPWTMDLGIEHL